jgi:N-acetylneuraminic acid mutarotase
MGRWRGFIDWCQRPSMIKIRQHKPANIIVLLSVVFAMNSMFLIESLQRAQLITAAITASTWIRTGSLKYGRRGDPPAVLLKDGRVLIAGGFTGTEWRIARTSEIYDPETGTWSLTGSMNEPRWNHVAVLLKNGKVLVVGGRYSTKAWPLASAELYDPATGE